MTNTSRSRSIPRVDKFLYLTNEMSLIEACWWARNTLPKYRFNVFKWIDEEYVSMLKFEQYIEEHIEGKFK